MRCKGLTNGYVCAPFPLFFQQLIVVLGYVVYAVIAVIGAYRLEMDIDELRGLPADSPTKIFRELSLKHFQYNIRVQVTADFALFLKKCQKGV